MRCQLPRRNAGSGVGLLHDEYDECETVIYLDHNATAPLRPEACAITRAIQEATLLTRFITLYPIPK